MGNSNISLLVDLWQKYNSESLSPEAAKKAVTETLSLPWVQQLNVFSDQAVVLLELHTLNYLYVSPSMEKITGYPLKNFTGAKFFISSLVSEEEFRIMMSINDVCMTKLSELNLHQSEMMRLRFSYNYFVRHRDGPQINILCHYMNMILNTEGFPLLQLVLVSDITAFNSKHEHFYTAVLENDDGPDRTLFSGKMESNDELISPREQEVLKLVSRGQSSEFIADTLKISAETVKTHRKNLLQKANAKDTIDLVRYGYANGWL